MVEDRGRITIQIPYEWGSMLERLNASGGSGRGGPLELSPLVQPVVNVDLLLSRREITSKNLDLTVTAGTFVSAYTVASGRIARVKMVRRTATVGTSAIQVKESVSGTIVATQAFAANAESYTNVDWPLAAGDQVGARATANGGDGVIGLELIVEESIAPG